MNAATALVLVVVIAIIAGAAYSTYRTLRRGECAGCSKQKSCANPINCSINTEEVRK